MHLTRRGLFEQLVGLRPQQAAVQTDPILHLLNRITWGVRPEEVARARELGVDAYLDEQLNPDSITDERLEKEMRLLPSWRMSRYELYAQPDAEWRAQVALQKGILAQAVTGRKQLLERVVDFWRDHFSISEEIDNTPDLILFERNVLRQHSLGKFREILIESARHPAMLVYLDNYVSTKEAPNENYARELLELHSLGVDGGYTEQDVVEVARAFTGWTIHEKTADGFFFNRDAHDTGRKAVLGHQLPAGRGIEDGLHVLSILANHPATARFVCRKLCVRFVSDGPPAELIDAAVATWEETDGEIRAILRTILTSTEFFESAGQKFRRPYEYLVGVLRATDTEVRDTNQLEVVIRQLGQYPHGWHPPNGYPDVAAAWVGAGGMLHRWNAAMWLTHTAHSDREENWGMTSYLRQQIGTPTTAGDLVDEIAMRIWGDRLPQAQRAQFINYATDGAGPETAMTPHLFSRKFASLFGLMLASPSYQWR